MARQKVHFHEVGDPYYTDEIKSKKVRPKKMAIVDEDNCTGCQVCVSFCPVDCISVVAADKYDVVNPPVQIRFDECIGCAKCEKACRNLTWDAIHMLPTDTFEELYGITIN